MNRLPQADLPFATGVFVLSCPDCEVELEAAHDARGRCPSCGLMYLIRFGHLVACP